MIKFYDKVLRRISGALVALSCTVLVLVSVFMVVDIIMRYCFKSPILGDVEIVETIMVIIVFSSFAYTQTEKGHIHVTMLIKLWPRKIGLSVYALNSLIVAVAAAAVTIGCAQQGIYVLEKNTVSAIIHIPYYPFYFAASFFMGVFTVVLFADAIINAIAIFDKEYEKRVTATWN